MNQALRPNHVIAVFGPAAIILLISIVALFAPGRDARGAALVAGATLLGLLLAILINAVLVRAAMSEERHVAELARQNADLERQDAALRLQTMQLAEQTEDLELQTAVLQAQATELEERAEELERERAFFDTILENLGEAVLACDARGVINFSNRAVREFSEIPPEGRDPARWSERYAFLHPDGTPMTLEELPLFRALRGEEVDDAEMVLAAPGRSPVRVAASARALPDVNGSGGGAVVLLRDVSAVVAAQEQLREADERLRQSQKMEAIGQLAGGIAHDFNNLLTAITSYAQLALESLPAKGSAPEDIREILAAVDRASALTRQLLAFSRKQVVRPQAMNINDAVSNAETLLSRLIGRNVELVVQTAPEPIVVEADPIQIEQVLLNLALNARDAITGRGKVIIETGSLQLDDAGAEQLGDLRPGPYAVIRVTDTGTGMDEETQKHVFEPFFTTKDPGKGTGLGLSTVYGIVRQAGGTVALYSAPGLGTTFRVYVPARVGEVPRDITTPARPGRSGHETVLVVEDEAQVRHVIRRVLESHGYKVFEAHNGREALTVLSQQHTAIDLVISDVIMPVMGGKELRDAIRQIDPGLPVILISGYAADALGEIAGAGPQTRLVEKPFTSARLLNSVRDALEPDAASPVG